MDDDLPDDVAAQVRSHAAEGRARLEAALFGRPTRAERIRLMLLRALGAVALGIFAAGFAILATVFLLNFMMHYIPS